MLDEYVTENNLVRFIDAFVDKLDLKKLGFKHSVPSDTKRPSYDLEIFSSYTSTDI